MGQALSGSRNLFALAEQGDLPPFFGRVHPRFARRSTRSSSPPACRSSWRCPGRSWRWPRPAPSAGCSSTSRPAPPALRLRDPQFAPRESGDFVVPFGPVIPMLAIADRAGDPVRRHDAPVDRRLAAIVAGAVLYVIAVRGEAACERSSRMKGSCMLRKTLTLIVLVRSVRRPPRPRRQRSSWSAMPSAPTAAAGRRQ